METVSKPAPPEPLWSRYGHLQPAEADSIESDAEHNPRGKYNLAALIWGHRLRVGQQWMEYMLEFMNVMAGFGFALGRGITTGEPGAEDGPNGYEKFKRIGLRRFVFYDRYEKTDTPEDDEAQRLLVERLQQDVLDNKNGLSDAATVELLRSLFRSFSAVEAQRSWFAKSLLPVHENLLFWEGLRKGATKRKSGADDEALDGVSARDLDDGMSFDSRNFFARGGEIYYLILSAGTRRDPELRTRIENGLRDLLTTHNQALGELAGLIDRTWLDCYGEGEEPPGASRSKLGWIPDPDNPLYHQVAEDVATFLSAELDSMEAISLLAHLICFHLAIYIYDRSDRVIEHLGFGEGERGVASPFLVDMLTASGDNTLRRVSATLFRAREARLKTCAKQFIEARVMDWVSQLEGHTPTEEGITKVDAKAVNFFGIKRLRKKSRASYEDAVNKLARQVRDRTATLEDVRARFSGILANLLMSDFNKNFLPVHRTKLGKSIRFVAPRTGRGARFVLGDDLLKAITISAVRKDEMTFDAFLDTLYERYKIVVGARHAKASGLLEQQRINSEYYLRNREALLERMVHAGLAQEFSDATAMMRPASY